MATRYIKLFETEANRQTYEHSANYQEPYSSGVVDTESAYYNKLDSSVSEIYRACAYIENPSTAYINTGIKGSGSQRIECEFMPMKQSTEWNCVYGARTGAGTQHDGIYIYSNNTANNVGYVGYNNTSTNNLASAYASLGVVHKVIQNSGTFTLDGNSITDLLYAEGSNIHLINCNFINDCVIGVTIRAPFSSIKNCNFVNNNLHLFVYQESINFLLENCNLSLGHKKDGSNTFVDGENATVKYCNFINNTVINDVGDQGYGGALQIGAYPDALNQGSVINCNFINYK